MNKTGRYPFKWSKSGGGQILDDLYLSVVYRVTGHKNARYQMGDINSHLNPRLQEWEGKEKKERNWGESKKRYMRGNRSRSQESQHIGGVEATYINISKS